MRQGVQAGPGSAGGFNHPNTFTPNSNQAAMDRMSDQRARVTRDDTPLVDPSTGAAYHGTSSTYDFVRGGWVNPERSDPIAQGGAAGRALTDRKPRTENREQRTENRETLLGSPFSTQVVAERNVTLHTVSNPPRMLYFVVIVRVFALSNF